MSIRTLVWSFQKLPELEDQLGLVECDQTVADELIAAHKVQDPRVGGLHLREMQSDEPPLVDKEYVTTQLQPPPSSAKRRK